ncbi:hypothetical protein ACS0TY_036049 [Phlomoides rotata]
MAYHIFFRHTLFYLSHISSLNMPKQRNYTNAEDRHLVQMWLDVSQDPAVGNNQSKAQFWQRIIEDYHS